MTLMGYTLVRRNSLGALKTMVKNFEVRFLLELWNFDGIPVGQGKLNKCFSVPAKKANDTREDLITMKAIEASEKVKGEIQVFKITDTGKALLKASLESGDFQFDAQIGKRTANVLLRWWRSQPSRGAMSTEKSEMISSYEAFKSMALETFQRLNKEYNYGGLVPIWHARQEIGAAVSRTQFNDWIMQMQAEQIFYLQTGEAIGATDAQKRDSIENEIRGLLFYISQPD
jgi:hypothetical protein